MGGSWSGCGGGRGGKKGGREGGGREEGGGGAQRRGPGGGKRGWGGRAPVPISAGKWRNRHKAFGGKVSCLQGRSKTSPWKGQGRGGEGVWKFALCCEVVAAARSRRGGDGCPLPSSLRGPAAQGGLRPPPSPCLAACSPPAAGAPARPPRSFSPPLGGDGGPPGQGHQGCCSVLLLRSAALGALRLDLGLSAGLRSDSAPAAVLKGQLRDCCGAPRGRERVLRAGLRLRGRRALTPVPLRPAWGRLLAVPAEARGPRRSDRGGGGGGSGRGEARLVRPGRRGAERPPPRRRCCRGCCSASWLACSLARSASSPPLSGHWHTARAAALAPGGRRRAGS